MTTKLGGVPITGFMTTTDDVDVYPTHLDELGKGGLHSAQDLTLRDAITDERRTEGMLCHVVDESAVYQLFGGVTNADWVLLFTIVDGEIVINQSLPKGYIFTGDDNGDVIKSPVLIDTKLDIIRMRAANLILGRPNEQFLSAQVLNEKLDGYMHNDGGNVTIKTSIAPTDLTLSENFVFRGDANGMASEVQRLELNNMATMATADPTKLLGAYNLYTGSINPLNLGEPTTTLAIQQCNLANLSVGKINMGAVISPLEDPLNFGLNRPKQVDKLPTDFLELPFNKVLIGNVFDRASAQDKIEMGNLPSVTFKSILRGDATNTLVESTDLTTLELRVDTIEDVTIPTIESDIAALEAEIAALEVEIAALEGEIIAVQAEIDAIWVAIGIVQGQIVVIQGQISSLGGRIDTLESTVISLQNQIDIINTTLISLQDQIDVIDTTLISLQNQIDVIDTTIGNLRLNNILADGDVSFYNYRLINLADPIDLQDGVNLQTLLEYRPYIHIYNNNNLLVTVVLANVYTKAILNSVLGEARSFNMLSDNTIEYIGIKSLVMQITASITVNRVSNGNSRDLSLSMYKNGSLIDGSIQRVKAERNNNKNLNTTSLTTINTGDILELRVSSTVGESLRVTRSSIVINAA